MKNIAILNLGSHDIKIKKGCEEDFLKTFDYDEELSEILEEGFGIQSNLCEFTKKLYEEYPKGIEYIEFPIVEPIIERVGKELSNGEKLEKIIFVTTEQDKADKKDTVYLGELFKKIKSDNKSELNKKLGFSNIKVNNYVIKDNPADYDVMMDRYKKIIESSTDCEVVYINLTGGTPAMNMSLLYNSTNEINIKVIPLYVNGKTKRTIKLRVIEELKKNKIKDELKTFIAKHLYDAAIMTIERNEKSLDVNKARIVVAMLNIAKDRREFNFEKALEPIDQLKYELPNSRDVFDRFEEAVTNLNSSNDLYMLNELKNNAIYKYTDGAYTDFLGRIFRIQEASYALLLRKNRLIKEKKDKYVLNKENLSHEQEEEIKNFKNDNGEKIEVDKGLNTYSMEKVLECILSDRSLEMELLDKLKQLDKLKKLRNKSILAHGYKGVSKQVIDDEIPNIEQYLNSLIEGFASILDIEIYDDKFYNLDDNYFDNDLLRLIEEL